MADRLLPPKTTTNHFCPNHLSTDLFLDDTPFYRICILLFSIKISATAIIKAKNTTDSAPSIFQNTHQLNT